jgi:hypothetical protein
MKRALMIAILVVVSVALVGTVFAAEKKAAKAMTFKGEVTKLEANMLTVKGEKGDMTFNVAGAKMGEYKAMQGDKVVVKYVEKDGKMMATAVSKAPAKAPKAPAKAK